MYILCAKAEYSTETCRISFGFFTCARSFRARTLTKTCEHFIRPIAQDVQSSRDNLQSFSTLHPERSILPLFTSNKTFSSPNLISGWALRLKALSTRCQLPTPILKTCCVSSSNAKLPCTTLFVNSKEDSRPKNGLSKNGLLENVLITESYSQHFFRTLPLNKLYIKVFAQYE